MKRSENDLLYEESDVLHDSEQGWKLIWSLLRLEVSALGHVEPRVDGVTLEEPLGRGRCAVVYKGIHEEKDVLVKIFRESMASSFHTEKAALVTLRGMNGVPNIEAIGAVQEHAEIQCHFQALILSPVGNVLMTANHRKGETLDGSHLQKLVQIVQEAHEKKLLHRDIKPHNAYLTDDNQILLNDWGSSVGTKDELFIWEGTHGYSVSASQHLETGWTGETCDLVALVRTAYVLICKESPPLGDEDAANEYWEKRIRRGTVWYTAMGYAKSKKYDKLGKLLCSLK